MRNNRRIKVIAWIMAAVMLLCTIPMNAMAVVSSPAVTVDVQGGPFVINNSAELVIKYYDNGKEIANPSLADRSKEFTMRVSVSQKDGVEFPDEDLVLKLPEIVESATASENDFVSWTCDAKKRQLIFNWVEGKQDYFSADVTIRFAGVYDLYNIAEINGTYYRLAKSTIRTDKILSQNLKKQLKSNEYEMVPSTYDFTGLTISINGKDYIYECPENAEQIRNDGKYYTVEFYNLDVVPNKIGAIDKKTNQPNWLIPEDQRYNDPNGTDSFHANYKITLHDEPNRLYLYDTLTFSINGGTGDTEPEAILAEAGKKVTLPSINATKNGQEFIGWAEVSDIYAKNPGKNLRYHEVYKPGTTYVIKDKTTTLYAIYNQQVRKVQFGIRADGVIQDEPNNYDVKNYIGHFTVDGILKEGHWVIDIDATKPVNGYYVENDVTNNLNWVPSAEQIAAALKKEGNVDFDPETQYIHYYVMKTTDVNVWKVDGVIRYKSKVAITYNTNITGAEKTDINNMPGSKQVVSGTEITIGADDDGNILRPVRKGYVFKGWNTAPDGSGTSYSAGRYMRLTSNLNLYAQWEEGVLSIDITPDWPEGKPAPSGTMITLTAGLHGFEDLVEGEDYILQWRYSTDMENWIDEPGAHGITFTYELNTTTATYTWKVVAVEPQE